MNNSPFDFSLDRPTKTVTINMQFEAELSRVWDAFTKPEILDQWYAPKPFTSRTKNMNFEVGGQRFYAMVSPKGQERWALQTYTSINPKTNFKMFNAFADEAGNPEPTGSDWNLNFSEQNGITTVNISIYNESAERLEAVIDGFKAGMAMTFENLQKLLAGLSGK
ncbi:SRPBCC family protein [Flavobacterium sp. 3HN19-14]|uniref:SRPBCC family protein n=1 Tax=Flavobacterium sp. 3HN19-14 TaxID=3448133 RepID=UPI003EE2B275